VQYVTVRGVSHRNAVSSCWTAGVH